MGILELMKERRIYFDGGMGSLLQARGLKPGELPETWNLSRPEIIFPIRTTGCTILRGSPRIRSSTNPAVRGSMQ